MRKNTATATIEIDVDDRGHFTYDVDGAGGGEVVHILRGSTVSWTSPDGNFSVLSRTRRLSASSPMGLQKGNTRSG